MFPHLHFFSWLLVWFCWKDAMILKNVTITFLKYIRYRTGKHMCYIVFALETAFILKWTYIFIVFLNSGLFFKKNPLTTNSKW